MSCRLRGRERDARRLGSGLLTYAMEHVSHTVSFGSYDRLFLSQDSVPEKGFGNLIALPFQGRATQNGNSLFVDESFEPYKDQRAFLSALPKVSKFQLDSLLGRLCANGDTGVFGGTTLGKEGSGCCRTK